MPSDARAILEWTIRTHPQRTALTVSFGGPGLVLAHMVSEIDRSVPVLFADTGYLFPETLAFVDEFAARYQLNVNTLTPAYDPGPLFLEDPDRCCHIRKVEPVYRALEGYDAWISALRRDQSKTRAQTQVLENHTLGDRIILKVHPLTDWIRADVDRYLDENEIPRHPLTKQGFTSIGCWPCTSPTNAGEHERDGRWRGRVKTECGLHTRTHQILRTTEHSQTSHATSSDNN